MKKIIFCDIDGTIVDAMRNMEKPSEKTTYAFKELIKNNLVFIASGRMKCLLDDNILKLPVSGLLLANGAYVNYQGETIINKTFSIENVQKVIDYCEENNGSYFIEYMDYLYTKSKNHENFKWLYDGWRPLREANVIEGTYDKEPCMMMCAFEDYQHIEDMKEKFGDFIDIVPHATGRSLDINIKNVSKGSAIKEVLEYFNIDKENAYAFGDGNNDIEMFGEVAHSIAMGNASEYVKSFAKEITDSVTDDGFYNYLVKNEIIKPIE